MAKQTKTIKVSWVLEEANRVLKNSVDSYTDGRQAVTMFIERVLMETGNYNGFGYLTEDDMKASKGDGCSFGINNNHAGMSMDEKFRGTDSTRVYYYSY